MNVSVSAPVKIFALVGLLAGLVLMGGMVVLGRGADDAVPTSAPLVEQQRGGVLDAPAAAKKVAATADAAAKAKAAGQAPARKPKARATAAAVPKAAAEAPAEAPRGIAKNGLPMGLVAALRSHDVVVVSLWGSGGKIDALARDEAAAGAKAAGVGFVAINVLERPREAEALTLKVGTVLRAPGILLYTRPDALTNQLDGFRDRDTVAQAALDALR